MTATDTGVPDHEGEDWALFGEVLYCLGPASPPTTLVTATFTQRVPPEVQPIEAIQFEKDAASFLRSLRIDDSK